MIENKTAAAIGSPYSFPHLYDIAFANRDFAGECAFLRRVAERILGRPLTSALELACGPGYHAREFARSGVRTLALDNSADMIGYAREQAAAEGNPCTFVHADMTDFTLAPETSPVDCAVTLLCGFAHLLTNDDIVRHFRAVAAALADGGVYILATAHPRDFYGDESEPAAVPSWTEERDDLRVTTTWGGEAETYDPISETELIRIRYEATQLSTGAITEMETATRLRRCSYQTFRALVALADCFDLVAEYGDFTEEIPFSPGEAAGRFLPVLRKR